MVEMAGRARISRLARDGRPRQESPPWSRWPATSGSRLALAVFGERARGTPRHGPVLRRSFKEKGDVGFGHRRATGSGGVRRIRQESASLCRVIIKKGGVGFGSRRTMGSAGSWERARRAPRSAARSRRIAASALGTVGLGARAVVGERARFASPLVQEEGRRRLWSPPGQGLGRCLESAPGEHFASPLVQEKSCGGFGHRRARARAVFGESARGTPRHDPALRRPFKQKGGVGLGYRRARGSSGVWRARPGDTSLWLGSSPLCQDDRRRRPFAQPG